MSRAVIQGIVDEMADAFEAAGLADAGVYTPPGVGATPVNCRVFISRGHKPFGGFGSVLGDATTLTLLLSEIPAPVRDATVVADGQTFTLVKELSQDDATSIWDVA